MAAPTRARGRTRRTPGVMNGLEKAWSLELDAKQAAGEIIRWDFEPCTLRLAFGRCTYKPDFLVITKEGYVEFHETKGHFENESKVRLKVAADRYPEFVFRLIQKRRKKDGGGFEQTIFGPAL
jgi:hypothetical protein